MNLKFYSLATLTFFVSIIGGFLTGSNIIYNALFHRATDPYGEEALSFLPFAILFSFSGSLIGLLVALIIIHRMGRKWGSQLNFGSHPVLKLTFLSFLTFLVLLVLLLFLIPSAWIQNPNQLTNSYPDGYIFVNDSTPPFIDASMIRIIEAITSSRVFRAIGAKTLELVNASKHSPIVV